MPERRGEERRGIGWNPRLFIKRKAMNYCATSGLYWKKKHLPNPNSVDQTRPSSGGLKVEMICLVR
jgi:hypothetical protein